MPLFSGSKAFTLEPLSWTFQCLNRIEAFKKTGLNMREQLDLRQYDIQWGERRGRASMKAAMKAAAEKMVQKGEMTQEQAEELLTRIEEFNQIKE
jgi:hypothetical protein